MSKKNGGINDVNDASGEQSHVDGNSGISNRIENEVLPDIPDELSAQQADDAYREAKTPTKRNSDVF